MQFIQVQAVVHGTCPLDRRLVADAVALIPLPHGRCTGTGRGEFQANVFRPANRHRFRWKDGQAANRRGPAVQADPRLTTVLSAIVGDHRCINEILIATLWIDHRQTGWLVAGTADLYGIPCPIKPLDQTQTSRQIGGGRQSQGIGGNTGSRIAMVLFRQGATVGLAKLHHRNVRYDPGAGAIV